MGPPQQFIDIAGQTPLHLACIAQQVTPHGRLQLQPPGSMTAYSCSFPVRRPPLYRWRPPELRADDQPARPACLSCWWWLRRRACGHSLAPRGCRCSLWRPTRLQPAQQISTALVQSGPNHLGLWFCRRSRRWWWSTRCFGRGPARPRSDRMIGR